MSKQVKLTARPRAEAGRNAVKQVRTRGAIPAVVYGSATAPANLEVNRREFEQLLAHAASEHVLIDLEIAGSAQSQLSIIQEVQHHPVSRDILHVDFHAVSASEEMTAEVPVEPEGESEGVKRFGGILQQLVQSLEIECLPKNLPEVIRVDVSGLGLGDAVHVRDIKLPAGVRALADEDLSVFLVSEPKVADEAETGTVVEPEVLTAKKPEAEGAAS